MAYTAPTASDLKARFPAFNSVGDAVVNQALAEAARMVDQSWTEGDFALGQMLYAAHTMALDGLGTTTTGALAAELPPGFKRIKSGGNEIERFPDQVGSSSGSSQLDLTTYGVRFKDLLRRNRGGAIAL